MTRKAPLTAEQLLALAEQALDLSSELRAAADRFSFDRSIDEEAIERCAQPINQLIEAASTLNRLVLARLANDAQARRLRDQLRKDSAQ